MTNAEDSAGDASDGAASGRWASFAFALSALSALVYFASSLGIRNFVGFLVDGGIKVARLLGLG